MDQNCQKKLSFFTHFRYSNLHFFNSTFFIFYQGSIPIAFYLYCSFLSILKFDLFIGIVLLLQTYLEFLTHPSGKLQLKFFVSGSQMMLSYYYKTLTLNVLWFCSLHWLIISNQGLDRHFFSLKIGSHCQILMLYAQSIISAPP